MHGKQKMISYNPDKREEKASRTNENSNDYADETSEIFSTTISSLTAEAAILRQLASIALVARMENNERQSNSVNNNGDLGNKNDTALTSGIMNEFRNIETLVTSLEKQMSVLQSFVRDEKQAMQALEEAKIAAEGQKKLIEEMRRGCKGINLPGEHLVASKSKGNNKKKEKKIDQSSSRVSGQQSSSIQQPPNIRLNPVTQEELLSVSKNIRGRITLDNLNNALADIKRVVQKKYSIMATRQGNSKATSIIMDGKPHRVSKKMYQDTLNLHRDLSMEEHEKHFWISEQELRDSCAFFRSGEGTARAILLVLRSLKRLRQVCGGGGLTTYVCL